MRLPKEVWPHPSCPRSQHRCLGWGTPPPGAKWGQERPLRPLGSLVPLQQDVPGRPPCRRHEGTGKRPGGWRACLGLCSGPGPTSQEACGREPVCGAAVTCGGPRVLGKVGLSVSLLYQAQVHGSAV